MHAVQSTVWWPLQFEGRSGAELCFAGQLRSVDLGSASLSNKQLCAQIFIVGDQCSNWTEGNGSLQKFKFATDISKELCDQSCYSCLLISRLQVLVFLLMDSRRHGCTMWLRFRGVPLQGSKTAIQRSTPICSTLMSVLLSCQSSTHK